LRHSVYCMSCTIKNKTHSGTVRQKSDQWSHQGSLSVNHRTSASHNLIYSVNQKILHPYNFSDFILSKTKNCKAIFYTHIQRLILCQTATFHTIISKFDKVIPH